MKTLFGLSLLCVGTLALHLPQSKSIAYKDLLPQKPELFNTKIIGGQDAAVGQFGWQVAVIRYVGGFYTVCGGSLIADQWVLTAAQCVVGIDTFTLYLGGISINLIEYGRIEMTSNEAYPHPNFNSATFNNDIALIKLPEPIEESDRIQIIRLPDPGEIVETGDIHNVIGWGATSDNNPSLSQYLQFGTVIAISNQLCTISYGSQVVISSTVCAVGNPIQSPCSGDAGGPLVVFRAGIPTLAGVISFVANAGCGLGLPSGYVRTESFLDWIDEVQSENP